VIPSTPIVVPPACASKYGTRTDALTADSTPFRFDDTYGYADASTSFCKYGMPSSKL
jgi:hypothetical protein